MVKETAELLIVQNSKVCPKPRPLLPRVPNRRNRAPLPRRGSVVSDDSSDEDEDIWIALDALLNLCHYRLQSQKDLRFVDLRDSTRDTTATLITNLGL